MNLKKALPIIFVAIAAAISVKALAIPDFYTSHDGETHTARLANFYLALEEGQFPPQLAPTLFGGFGFPIFIFIYPLPYAVGSLFHFLGLSYTDSAELTMALGQILSAVFFYIFFKLETKNTPGSILASLFVTWAPYRFLMIFVRGAFAESFAYIFIATSLICLNRLFYKPSMRWIGLAGLSFGGLLLSHQLVSAMFLPVLVFYCLTKLINHPHKLQATLQIAGSILLGFAIAGYIYLPAFFERQYLRFDELISYHQDHFVTPWQLVRSPWSYGFSHPGTINDDMSFQIGLTHLVIVAFTLFILFLVLIHNRRRLLTDATNRNLVLWLFVFVVSVFVMINNPATRLAWKHVPGLSIVDFPWRFLGVATFAAGMLAAYLMQKLNNHIFIFAFLAFFIFYANRNHLRINETMIRDDNYFNNYPATATWKNEFLPKLRRSNVWQGIEKDYQVWSGEARLQPLIIKTQKIDLQIEVTEAAEIILHRLYFPGWRVYVDGQEQQYRQDNFQIIDTNIDLVNNIDYSGFITTRFEPGTYRLTAVFTPTLLRQTGFALSLLGLLTAIILAVKKSPQAHA